MLLRRVVTRNVRFSTASKSKVMTEKSSGVKAQPDYEGCIEILNGLQSNAQYIKSQASSAPTHSHNSRHRQLEQMQKYLLRTGLSSDKLDELSVVHVAGTKGKGTTCALSESILRHHGYKTGFYSSPHLLEVRERIRINGKPIDKNVFAEYFWRIYTALDQQKSDTFDMPLYFRFLTVMAFHIFLEQKVDVAILEVGIGGEHDCTNVLRKVPVVGITSLGMDHTSLLGNTLRSIAWNKGGIMKEGCKAFTVPQPDDAMDVLRERSLEKHCHLEVVDSLRLKFPPNTSCPSHILNLNAGLAVALCNAWISVKQNNNLIPSLSKDITETALARCVWPGRFQVKQEKNITYYLDGAHTFESITICSDWFKDMTKKTKHKRALMFNVTGNRDSRNLLKQLLQCNFHGVLFVTNTATKSDRADNINYKLPTDDQLDRCEQHKKVWLKLVEEENLPPPEFARTFSTILEATEFLNARDRFDLLITGSLHLIGGVLSIVEPDLNENLVNNYY